MRLQKTALFLIVLGAMILAFSFGANAQILKTFDLAGRHNGFVPLPQSVTPIASSLEVNGKPVTSIEFGSGLRVAFDGTTALIAPSIGEHYKGAATQGNLSVAGDLIVSGNCTFNTTNSATERTNVRGALILQEVNSGAASSWSVPANAGTATIQDDAQTGTGVAITLPTEVNGQVMWFYNADDSTTTGDLALNTLSMAVVVGTNGAWHKSYLP